MSIQKSKITLLEEISTLIRREHYSLSTERTYCAWVRQFVKFHHMQTREILLFLKIWLCKSTPCRYFISKGWIHIKTVILRNALLSAFSKNIKQLTYAGCQSEIPPNSSRFRMNRKYCYQSATKFSTVILTSGVEKYFTRMGLWRVVWLWRIRIKICFWCHPGLSFFASEWLQNVSFLPLSGLELTFGSMSLFYQYCILRIET